MLAVGRRGDAVKKYLRERNPRYGDWEFRGNRPGEAVAFGVHPIGTYKGVWKLFICCVVDTYSSCVSAKVYDTRASIDPTEILERARDFYDGFGLKIDRIKIHMRPYKNAERMIRLESYLEDYKVDEGTEADIHWRKALRLGPDRTRKEASGFVRHFSRMAKCQFFDPIYRPRSVKLAEMQNDFDEWLTKYNQVEKLLGYHTAGATPMQMIETAQSARSCSELQSEC